MPRTRLLHPGFFANEVLAELPMPARLLFAGLWTLADREGRLEDRPRRIKAELFPYDDMTVRDVDEWLDGLAERGFILRYAVEDGAYIQVANFSRHQTPHVRERALGYPAPHGAPHGAPTPPPPDGPTPGDASASTVPAQSGASPAILPVSGSPSASTVLALGEHGTSTPVRVRVRVSDSVRVSGGGGGDAHERAHESAEAHDPPAAAAAMALAELVAQVGALVGMRKAASLATLHPVLAARRAHGLDDATILAEVAKLAERASANAADARYRIINCQQIDNWLARAEAAYASAHIATTQEGHSHDTAATPRATRRDPASRQSNRARGNGYDETFDWDAAAAAHDSQQAWIEQARAADRERQRRYTALRDSQSARQPTGAERTTA